MNPFADGIRQTHLDLAHKCMRQLWFYLHEGPKRPNYFMVNGVAGHLSIEHGFRYKQVNGQLPSMSELLDVYTTKFDEGIQDCEKGGRVDPVELRARMTGSSGRAGTLPLFFRDEAPQMQPRLLEKPFEVKIPGIKTKLIGTIDYLDESGELSDYKFRSGKKGAPSQNEVNTNFQLPTYRIGVEQGLGLPVTKMSQIQLVCNPEKAADVKRMEQVIETGNLSTSSILSEYRGIVRFVQKAKGDPELYPMTAPSNWWCSRNWCGWHEKCPRFGGNHV